MSVTGYHRASIAEREQLLAEIDRLTGSHVLHGSESLCKLLRYLAEHALHHPGVPLKEYQIATEVFGRPADFDPQSDSTIRVQAGRLRAKLSDYYANEGADDAFVVDMPKGSYALSFRYRETESVIEPAAFLEVQSREAASRRALLRWKVLFGLALLLFAISLIMLFEIHRFDETASANSVEPAPAPFRILWSHFLSGPDEPWVIFSNAAFLGRPETGMRYYDPKRDAKGAIWDHYTGVGEVLA